MEHNNFVRKFNYYDRESKMRNIMTVNEISAIATAKVNEFIEKGYVFNFGTMAGSQGDVFYADLVKGDITYRVRVYSSEDNDYNDLLVLEVRRVERGFVTDFLGNTIWNSDGEVVESRTWYRVNRRGGKVYTDDFENIVAARMTRKERRMSRRDNDEISVISPEKVLERVRSHRGYKQAKVSDIKRVYRTTADYGIFCHAVYVVEFNNYVSKVSDLRLKLNQ
nr:MAG TPA: hypothetical protein [Caudoviricetes sp.]